MGTPDGYSMVIPSVQYRVTGALMVVTVALIVVMSALVLLVHHSTSTRVLFRVFSLLLVLAARQYY